MNDLKDVLDKWCPVPIFDTRKPKAKKMDNKIFTIIIVSIAAVFLFPLMITLAINDNSSSSKSPARVERLKAGDEVEYRIGSFNTEIVVETDWSRDEPIRTAYINKEGQIAYGWYPAAILRKIDEEDEEEIKEKFDIPVREQMELEKKLQAENLNKRIKTLEELNFDNRLIRLEKFLEARYGIPGHIRKPELYKK
jgi:hypothetical protein